MPQDVNDQVRRSVRGALAVLAYASDDKTLLSRGKVTLIDNQIDMTTGTLRLKATFENTDERLWPGPVRQCAPGALDEEGRHHRAPTDGHAGRQRLLRLYCEVRQHCRAADRRGRRHPGRHRHHHYAAFAVGEKIVVDGQYRLSDGAQHPDRHAAVAAPRRGPTAQANRIRAAQRPTNKSG